MGSIITIDVVFETAFQQALAFSPVMIVISATLFIGVAMLKGIFGGFIDPPKVNSYYAPESDQREPSPRRHQPEPEPQPQPQNAEGWTSVAHRAIDLVILLVVPKHIACPNCGVSSMKRICPQCGAPK